MKRPTIATIPLLTIGAGLAACGAREPRAAPAGDRALADESCIAAVVADDHDGNAPANVLDDDLSTRWSSSGKGSWIEADLGQTRDVCVVTIAWHRGDERRSDFTIEASSDGVSWMPRFTGRSSGTTLDAESYPIMGTNARFIRVVVDGNTQNDWASITELGAPACGDVQAIASVSADDDDGNAPANVLDGDLGTRWSSAGTGSWIQADLGVARELGAVAIAWYKGDVRRADFRIEVSQDATTWSSVHEGESSGATRALEPYRFPAVDARWIRVTVDGNSQNDWASITELVAVGAAAACGDEPALPPMGTSGGPGEGSDGGATGTTGGGADEGEAGGCSGPAVDDNGVAYLELPGFSYVGGVERTDWTENFKSNGSMRHDFEGTPEGNQCVVGYFVVEGPDDEEISAKLGGGPHSDDHPGWADTHDLGLINFAGDRARLRFEEEHPDYTDSYESQEAIDIGDIRGKWVGAMGCKLNLDKDADGEIDHVWYLGYVDPEGLDAQDQPKNAWVKTLDLELSVDDVALKSPTVPYVTTIGEADQAQATIRVDEQDSDDYQYRYIAYRSPVPCGD